MLLPKEEPKLDGPLELPKSLQNLRKSIQSLLGSKRDLTFRWAESVRFIIEDLSGPCEPRDSPSDTSPLEPISEQDWENVEQDICRLEGELAKLRALLKEEDSTRSHLLNKYLDLKGNVRVFCRVRPLLCKEQHSRAAPVVTPALNKLLITASGKRKAFQLDKVFLPASSQDEVFAEVGPLVRSALDGHNVCVFAYGQTGAGKTFTMEGTKDFPGIVPRTLQLLFHQASLDSSKSYLFTLSMLELYMGSLRDLLVPSPRRITDPSPKCLSIQMDVKGRVEVENLSEFVVKDANQASQLYRIGSRARSTARTNSNEVSSRSHCLMRVTMASSGQSGEHPVLSKLWLIDLGGSERLLKTDAKGRILEEGKAINLSLSALGDVISSLQKKQPHIPYRNSKLTQILRDSLGEDAKTVMLVHVSPREEDVGETICSLGFATRARGIHLGKELSLHEKEERARVMEDMRQQLEEHDSNCEYLRDKIQELEFLCRKKKEMLMCNDKYEADHTKDLALVPTTIPERNPEKKDVNEAGCWVVGRPRFMTATTSSRLKERFEASNAGIIGGTGKGEKAVQPLRRLSSGCIKRRAAKVSPLDTNLSSEQGPVSDHKLQHVGSDAKLIQQIAALKSLSITPTSKVIDAIENEFINPQNPFRRHQEQPYRRSSNAYEHARKATKSTAINRRRLTVECSGQITINTMC